MELNENYQFNYSKLLKFLSRTGGSGYMFAMADDYRFILQINNSLLADLEKTNVACSVIFLRSSDETLMQQIKNVEAGTNAIIVANLYEHINNSSTGLNQLLHLNFSREELRHLQTPILFWADVQSLNIIANQAPDLFSQRRFTTIHFTGTVEHPIEEVFEKPDWKNFIETEKFKETEAKIETLRRRLQDAEGSGYNPLRIAAEIAIPLAHEYAVLGLLEKAEPLVEKYKPFLDSNSPTELTVLAKVYYALHQHPLAIETLQMANGLLGKTVEEKSSVYSSEWFDNTFDIADWMVEYGLPNEAKELLLEAKKNFSDNAGQYAQFWVPRKTSLILDRLGDIAQQLGNLLQAKDYFEKGLVIAEKLQIENPHSEQPKRDLFISYNNLGDIAQQLGNLLQAKDYFEKGLVIAEKLQIENPHSEQPKRDLFISYSRLGDIAQQLGNLQQAKDYFEKGLVITEKLQIENPHSEQPKRDLFISYSNLGDIAQQLGNLQQAKDYFEKGLVITEKLQIENPHSEQLKRDFSISYNKLGSIAQQLGNLQQAKDYFEKGLIIVEKLQNENPHSEQLKRDLSISYNKLGNIAQQLGNLQQGKDYFEKGLIIVEKLQNENPHSEQLKRDLFISYSKLGNIAQQLGNLQQAKDYFEKGLIIAEKLQNENPHSEELKRDLSVSYDKMGDIAQQLSNLQQAKDYFEKGLVIAEKLQNENPYSEVLKRDVAVSNYKFGLVSEVSGNHAEAIHRYKAAENIFSELSKNNPHSQQLKNDVQWTKDKITALLTAHIP